jgi:hypothetical protein
MNVKLVAPMNLKQMAVLTATVVALVVIVTLMKVGLGPGNNKGDQGQKITLTNPHLNFAATQGPRNPFDQNQPPEREVMVEGHHDFWFTNDNPKPVDLFVSKVSCNRCLSVKVGLAPDGWNADQPPGSDVAWTALETEELHENAKGFTVPPSRGGWVRLTWKDEEAGPKRLSAELRTTSDVGLAPGVRLEFGGMFVDPVRVLPEGKELEILPLKAGDGRPHPVFFIVYSSTRNEFTLTPESEEDQKRNHPFVTCGAPQALSAEKCLELEKEHKHSILCAYRVPVTVWERLKDGKEHDLGPYRSGVTLKSDALEDDLALYVRGVFREDGVEVLCDENIKDRVAFGNFRRDGDAVKTVRVETRPGTALKIDRVPEFMKAELKDESDGAGKTWGLTVTIPANAVNGAFPRRDDPTLSDTSIYLKANGRLLRIPVSGAASQR